MMNYNLYNNILTVGHSGSCVCVCVCVCDFFFFMIQYLGSFPNHRFPEVFPYQSVSAYFMTLEMHY